MPARVILQDFTGVPAVVDLAAMRDAMADLGGDPARVNPLVPADLVIDHSVQVDRYGTADSFAFNVEREYERNGERYQLLRWAQTAFDDLRVVPPGTGIVHQVNLEYLATVVTDRARTTAGASPSRTRSSGTDSHTTMVNGLGVLGYGVGGIEAEAVLLGQPLYQPMPRVVGVRLSGELPQGATATDLVLVVTEMLRRYGVVGAFVEFAGDGLAAWRWPTGPRSPTCRPEFGATATLFPIDDETLAYLRLTGPGTPSRVALVERYAQGAGPLARAGRGARIRRAARRWTSARSSPAWPGRAGPRTAWPCATWRQLPGGLPRGLRRRPGGSRPAAAASPATRQPPSSAGGRRQPDDRRNPRSVAIAAITSCTNTSNPTVMVGAGLLARNAVARGLTRPADRQDEPRARLAGRDRVPASGPG